MLFITNEKHFLINCYNIYNFKDFKSSTKLMIDKNLLKQTNMSDIGTTLVMHCPNAFGVSFTHINGWKVTYSGDTMPCDSLVKLG